MTIGRKLLGALPSIASCLSTVAAVDSWHVEGEPKVIAQDIHFTNADVRLAGTLYLPEKGEHLPAVIALHGASDATREAAIYRHLRESLPAIGVAVLIYDRRGSGASSGSLQGTDYETLADDAIAAQKSLAQITRIDSGKIGFWGFSQGGWLAPLAAERSKTRHSQSQFLRRWSLPSCKWSSPRQMC